MKIETVPIDSLVFDPTNARKHDTKNLEAIKGSLAKFGMQKPIVVTEDNVVIAGNGTLEAAKALGWEKIDIHRTVLKGAEAMAYALADNQSGALASWDEEILKEQIAALSADGWDVADFGFDVDDFDLAEKTEGNTDPDEVPEVEENKFGVERGQIWQLGEHRMMCGDSTSADDVAKLMAGEKADMVFTDPPYGMNLDTDWSQQKKDGNPLHSKLGGGKKYKPVEGDSMKFDPSLILSLQTKETFIFGADYFAESIPERNEGSWIVWDKCTTKDGSTTLDKGQGSNFELCWSKVKHKRELARIVHKGLFSVENDKRVHPTQKPVVLAEWFFERWGKDCNLVVDLFLGSGSTLIACEKTGRKCYGMEIDPHYCSVIIERWQNFTGKTAERING